MLIQLAHPSTSNPFADPNRDIAAHLNVAPRVQSIFNRSCDDCHSNRTVWPWYSHVAPVSWLVAYDVNHGRRHVNFSEWEAYPPDKASRLLDEICREIQDGDMPPFQYRPMHAASGLTPADKQQVCEWTANTKRTLSAGGAQ
ncbi:MAG TPA: heme-binding domain-containing protein [Terriglobia bacterium]|nr:heme-binding domain-containing protein [Terriglobia bacterium]